MLWITKVHHFVHEFINNHEIVADGFFFENSEIIDHNLDKRIPARTAQCRVPNNPYGTNRNVKIIIAFEFLFVTATSSKLECVMYTKLYPSSVGMTGVNGAPSSAVALPTIIHQRVLKFKTDAFSYIICLKVSATVIGMSPR